MTRKDAQYRGSDLELARNEGLHMHTRNASMGLLLWQLQQPSHTTPHWSRSGTREHADQHAPQCVTLEPYVVVQRATV